MKKISIICPIYNEEKSLPFFIEEIKKVENKISDNYQLDIVFSNNSSTDRTLSMLEEFSKKYKNIYYYTLSKN